MTTKLENKNNDTDKVLRDYGDGIAPELETLKRNTIAMWFLALLPIGLFLGTSVGLYRYFNKEEELSHKASKQISKVELEQIIRNYSSYFGDRNFNTEAGLKATRAVSNNLAGELQSNNSMLVSGSHDSSHEAGGVVWSAHWADIKGSTKMRDVFYVVTTYDGVNNLGNAVKIALPIVVAKSLAANELDYTLRFVFAPEEKDLKAQQAWVETHCMKPSESNIGMFFLSHGEKVEKDTYRQDSWKPTGGDILWADELLKGSRVMHFGIANLQHGVFDIETEFSGSEIGRIERAAHGLRTILFMVMGGDR